MSGSTLRTNSPVDPELAVQVSAGKLCIHCAYHKISVDMQHGLVFGSSHELDLSKKIIRPFEMTLHMIDDFETTRIDRKCAHEK